MFAKDMQTHTKSKTCQVLRRKRGNEKKVDEQERAENVQFFVNGKRIGRVRKFNYLGRILRDDDDDTECIEGQLKKARARWNGIARILKREGANARVMGKFYLVIIQALLLYGADSWTI